MARQRFKIALDIDDRTNAMTDAALVCRTFGHKWERRSASRSRTLELLKVGCVEYSRYCEHGCGSTWRQVWSFREQIMVENERIYPKNGEYLLPPRTGRLNRNDVRMAQFAREFPDLVS
jgi:hypothetical protein